MERTEARARCAKGRGQAGFSLVEVMVASGILLVVVLTIYESVLFCNRVAYDVKSRLAAEAIAFDTAWELYNKQLRWLRQRAPVAVAGRAVCSLAPSPGTKTSQSRRQRRISTGSPTRRNRRSGLIRGLPRLSTNSGWRVPSRRGLTPMRCSVG